MNNFEDVYALNRDERQISNLETYRRFISKGDKPLQCINDDDAKAIKDVLNGKGKLLAVVDGRRSMAGNHKYVLFVKEEGGVKVYLYTVLNGLYNEMGPYKDLDTAMSNADCYGLFEEQKELTQKRILESMDEEEFEDWDDLGYDDPDAGVDNDETFYAQDSADFYDFDGYGDDGEWRPGNGRIGTKSSDKEFYAAETAGADDGYYAGDMDPEGKDREYEDNYDFNGYDYEYNFDPERPSTFNSFDDDNAFGGRGRLPNNEQHPRAADTDPYGVSDTEKEVIDWNTNQHGFETVDYDPFEESKKQLFDNLIKLL